jgi:peptidoglycan/xylan/chitin deacetylase (PgdA/CDA1 family)
MTDSGTFAWPEGAKRAVSLCYDGALPEHTEIVLPLLDRLGLKGTFYVSPSKLLERPEAWRKAVANGHEIGNHSLYGVSADGRLSNWTLAMVRDDLAMTQKLIREVLGVTPSTAALPGPDTTCAEGNYRLAFEDLFEVVRTRDLHTNDPESTGPSRVAVLQIDTWPMAKVDEWCRGLLDGPPSWDAYVFERIFLTDHAEDAHEALTSFLASHRDAIWTATVTDIAGFIGAAKTAANA